MTENKRFQYNVHKNSIEYDGKHFAYCNGQQSKITNKLNELHSTVIYQRQNIDKLTQKNSELEYENKKLKAKVDDKEVAVEVETCKLMEKVFALIDKKIDELEKRYKFGQEIYHGCPMHNIVFGINTLKELKKELQE